MWFEFWQFEVQPHLTATPLKIQSASVTSESLLVPLRTLYSSRPSHPHPVPCPLKKTTDPTGSYPCSSAYSGTWNKWDRIDQTLSCVTFAQCVLEIHVCYQDGAFGPSCWSSIAWLCPSVRVCSPFDRRLAVFSLGRLRLKLQWTCSYVVCVDTFSSLLGKHLGVESLGRVPSVCPWLFPSPAYESPGSFMSSARVGFVTLVYLNRACGHVAIVF